jgi:hypothetical protein
MSVQLNVTVSQRDVDRIAKRLDKWQGKPLADRLKKATQGALQLLVNPIRFGAARHSITGKTVQTVKVTTLRKRAGELWAMKVGVRTWYAHFVIAGTSRGVEADPYVDRAYEPLKGEIQNFIDYQVRRLA